MKPEQIIFTEQNENGNQVLGNGFILMVKIDHYLCNFYDFLKVNNGNASDQVPEGQLLKNQKEWNENLSFLKNQKEWNKNLSYLVRPSLHVAHGRS